MSQNVEKFKYVRDIPYAIPLTYGEVDHCCSGKNRILLEFLTSEGFEVRFRVCTFRWSNMNFLPEEVLSLPHEDESTHAYLEFRHGEEWRVVDATWDKGIGKCFTIEEWDGVNSTGIAVKPIEIFSLEKSLEIMQDDSRESIEKDLVINGTFYKAFNEWLESLRKESIDNPS